MHAYDLVPSGVANHFGVLAAPDFAAGYGAAGLLLLGLHYLNRSDTTTETLYESNRLCYNSSMKKLVLMIALFLFVAGAAWAADWMKLATSAQVTPGIGETELVASMGNPEVKTAPVGYPAVSRWTYPDGTQVVLLEGRVVDAFYEVK